MTDEPWHPIPAGTPESEPGATWPVLPPNAPPPRGPWERPTWRERLKRALAPLAGIGAALVKFGAILVKFKALTVVGSMVVSVLAYTTIWGWKFAVGFVLLIFVHEMGHVVVLRARGIKASAPVFLPFLGAFVAMKSAPRSVYEEAESALAGPVFGTAGALLVAYAGHARHSDFLLSLAFTGLFLNLFNLFPVLPLDGGRVAGALNPVIWLLGLLGLLAYEIERPSPIVPIILILGGYELYRRFRDRNSTASQVYFALRPRQRVQIGTAYIALLAVIVVSMHATYVHRTFSS